MLRSTGLEINFLTHLQNLASASKNYSLKWNHYLLKFRSNLFKAEDRVAEKYVQLNVALAIPTCKMRASKC